MDPRRRNCVEAFATWRIGRGLARSLSFVFSFSESFVSNRFLNRSSVTFLFFCDEGYRCSIPFVDETTGTGCECRSYILHDSWPIIIYIDRRSDDRRRHRRLSLSYQPAADSEAYFPPRCYYTENKIYIMRARTHCRHDRVTCRVSTHDRAQDGSNLLVDMSLVHAASTANRFSSHGWLNCRAGDLFASDKQRISES